ncbi:MAG: hypothetical protein C0483_25520 [Pirellula sp.]|nr:hypothetical protein [Pirellula sp.]
MSETLGVEPVTEGRSSADTGFGRPFWFSYAANFSMMVSVSLLFVYGEFIESIGGEEWNVGWIVGTGMVGGILMRFAQGVGIDRFGPRRVWLVSNVGYVTCCLLHLAVTRVDTPWIYLLRIAYQSSCAGIFGASIAYVSGRAPIARMAEVIGTLGTSGFVGMMAGTALGRVIVGPGAITRERIDAVFLAAAALGTISFFCTLGATHGHVPRKLSRRGPPLWWLIRRYNPGLILLMSIATGIGLNLPTVFLVTYMESIDLSNGLMVFFNLYPPVAFVARILMRRVPDRLGIRPMIALGIGALVIGLWSLIPVRETWHLVLPALFIGVAHASLFPAVVAGGSGAFPGRWRGTGTTLVLAMFDVGTLVGAPLAGAILTITRSETGPNYGAMFGIVGLLILLAGIVYFGVSRRAPMRRGT